MNILERIKIGDIIGGKNKVLDIIGGEGKTGMGVIYVCYNTYWGFVVALKTFQQKFFFSIAAVNSFEKEAHAWMELGNHPYIVRVLTVDRFNERPFISMEYIFPDNLRRNTLTHHLKYQIPLEKVLKWGIQFCYGMEHATSCGIQTHRDIKPDNIMITLRGDLKITDFGLAKFKEYNEPDGEKAVGTLPWMAPEQYDGIANIKSDIYSFGVVLYQMVNNGKLPFYANSFNEYKEAHKSQQISHFNSVLFDIIDKCLAKSSGDRYNDFKELRLDLEKKFQSEIGKPQDFRPKIINNDFEYYSKRGYSFMSLRSWDEAIEELEKAVTINNEDWINFVNLGDCYKHKGLHDKAIIMLKKALEINPDAISAWYNLGLIYNIKFLKNKRKEVLEEIKGCSYRIIVLDSNISSAYHLLSIYYQGYGDLGRAIKNIMKCIEIDPNQEIFYQVLATLYLDMGNPNKAILAYKKCIQINPQSHVSYYALGMIYNIYGKYEEAIQAYGTAYHIAPSISYSSSLKSAVIMRDKHLKPKWVKKSNLKKKECPKCKILLNKVAEVWMCQKCRNYFFIAK